MFFLLRLISSQNYSSSSTNVFKINIIFLSPVSHEHKKTEQKKLKLQMIKLSVLKEMREQPLE